MIPSSLNDMMQLDQLPGSLPDEKILQVYRRHPLTLIGLFLSIAILFFLPIGAWIFFQQTQVNLAQNPNAGILIILGGSLFFLFGLLFLYQQFLDYWLDLWILTTRRIINIEQTGLFSRVRSEVRLYRVQDVTSEIHGLVRSLFDFGMVYIQTAGEQHRFTFEDIARPKFAAKEIMMQAEKDQRVHEQEITTPETINKQDPQRYQRCNWMP